VITSTVELIKLTAAEGMTLTNGEAYGKEIYLGCNDTADNWREITDSEAEALQAENNNETL
jgi:hypothetical protein